MRTKKLKFEWSNWEYSFAITYGYGEFWFIFGKFCIRYD